jgi:hypothetical protein
MAAEVIDLARERARRRPEPDPILPLTMPANLPALCRREDVAELFRYLEAQIG